MPRAIWKGAITFGRVHVPVALHPASQEEEIDFDWLDKRSMDPVGYKRINKRTGREIHEDHIVTTRCGPPAGLKTLLGRRWRA